MNPIELVIPIIVIVMLASVIKTAIKYKAQRHEAAPDPEADRLRDEVKVLKDRIAVLERIATDKSMMLDREIEELRHR